MLFGLITRRRLTTLKMRYARGSSWIGIILTLGIITANLKLFEEFIISFLPSWLPMQAVIIASVPAYFGACYLIGWIDERKGIWKSENSYGWEVTPESMELIATIRMMREYIEEQRARENALKAEPQVK
ncbi:MAG: hypothetical protein A4E28_02862 [Methanocella sp. PtaU1.Bin125]|nr:MAG: hypothetical protein A4E28_02862 [Methanocella sp. PtaU1.Bin125]